LAGKSAHFVIVVGFILSVGVYLLAQTQTTGRIAGTVRDAQGAVIASAEVVIENPGTADKHSLVTDTSGSYSFLQLSPGYYDVSIRASGFTPAVFHAVAVGLGETTTINVTLQIAQSNLEVTVNDTPPTIRSDGAQLESTIDAHSLETLPLPTRNLLQLLTLAPGVTAPLTNNSAIGRNSPNVSVNGSRITQNSYQINGVDANDISLHDLADVAVPAPETVSEVNVQTSLYDSSVAGAGGSVQVVTKSGSNFVHGSAYEYFRNEAFNANDANLKAVGKGRPEMRRNVYGATLGGPFRKNKAFFFLSYQGTREANGATDQSLYKSVLIAPGLTDDRSTATLMSTFGVGSIDPISLKLLNAKLPNGRFLIPTPQTPDGLVTGTALSTYHEEQFNANLDNRLGASDAVTGKFFFAHAPLFSALAGSKFGAPASLPGFGTQINVDNRVLSLQEIHTFSPTAVNEVRFGYSFIRHDELPQESVKDSSLGIQRSTANQYPGLPLILLARDQGGASIGTSDITYRGRTPSVSIGDVLSLQRGKQSLRFGGEILHSEWRAHAAVFSYGEIDFPTFNDFLIGNTAASQFPGGSFGFAHLGTGLTDRDFITTDYHLFAQDDWKLSSKLTLNLGLRYELDPPPYDSQGRIGGFDPALYRPQMAVDSNGFPLGPPAAGIIEAGNALPRYSLSGVSRVGKRMLNSVDPNNFGPRVGLAWSPLSSARLAIRAGYGIFYARPSFFYLALGYFAPPFFLDSDTSGQPFNHPFATAPPESNFPLIQTGNSVSATVIDRNARTPYTQQFNTSVQYELPRNTTLQVAYAGSRGMKLFRGVAVNQAQIASLNHPITNAVTGQVITDNSIENASLRAPLQGVSSAFFLLNESSAQSTYHSLQTSLNRRFSRGLQFSASYTFSKSIDNASNPGGGANSDGSLDRSGGLDTANVWGNQLNPRANRGLSDFDRTHYFVFSSVWNLPEPAFARGSAATRLVFSNWQVSSIVTAMSGLPVDVFDPTGGLLYGLFGARPNWAPAANAKIAKNSVPAAYYFNPSAFSQAMVQPGQPIPSVHDPTAVVDPAAEAATDIGNVGRNVLRGPNQSNLDFSVGKRCPLAESKALEFHADFFNLLNHPNRDNPVSDISTADFGKVLSFSSSPRIVQFALKFTF
jgi:Carboxypeptidase regulatory-like domain/TonB-dependent Receptor Plug Domain/TonB dependent receptor